MKQWILLGFVTATLAAEPLEQVETKAVPELFMTSDRCLACHNGLITDSGENVSIGAHWQASMMANSARDPYWQAAVRRECMEHPTAKAAIQNECAGCHMPMTRYHAKAMGKLGSVFDHLPIVPAHTADNKLAADGVSCTLCHQITPEHLGDKESFTAGFVIDHEKAWGERSIYGPHEVDKGRTRVMQSSSLFKPGEAKHLEESAFCASCHTLYTHTLDENGKVIGTLPEQVPYLEWQHSVYNDKQHCQSCHMPELKEPMSISSVVGQDREQFSQHVFRGGNFFMPQIFNRHRAELGVKALPQDLAQMSRATEEHLRSQSADIAILQARISEDTEDTLNIHVQVTNLAGHKLPTAYPSRRTWIHMQVKDRQGRVNFESGALEADGAISGNDNDLDAARFESHHQQITRADQVQIYEAIMVDSKDRVTTSLLSALHYAKDNRLLPKGFDKTQAPADVAVHGLAENDSDFIAAEDRIWYRIPITPGKGPYRIQVELYYQPIAYRWAHNLLEQRAAETERFVSYYQAMASESAVCLAHDERSLP